MNSNYNYTIWKKILLNEITIESIMHELIVSKLPTRSGNIFVNKLMSINRNNNQYKYLICNAAEGEPGTFKDRDLLLNYPEKLLEGMAIIGFIIGANIGYIYIKDTFIDAFALMQKNITCAYKEKILGKNLLNSDVSFDVYSLYGAGRYISGEASAMLESIEGKKAFPRINPQLSETVGLYGEPTIIVNVETLVNIPEIIANGGSWYCNLSNAQSRGGKKIFSISGHVANPGNYEVPLGIPFLELLNIAGGIKPGKKLKAVLPGGLSSPVLPSEIIGKLNLDYDSLTKAGSTLVSGGIIVMDSTTCMVEILCRIIKFFMDESCGQCVPCREGTGWLYKIMIRIVKGYGTLRDLQNLDQIADNVYGKNLCPLGDNAALSVKSFMKYFREEFIQKITIGSKVNAKMSN